MAVEKNRTVASGAKPEKAVLVAVDLGPRSRNSRGGALGARTGVVCSGSADITNLDLDESEIPSESADLGAGRRSRSCPMRHRDWTHRDWTRMNPWPSFVSWWQAPVGRWLPS